MGLNVFILRYQISIWSLEKTFKGEYIQEKILTFASVGNLLIFYCRGQKYQFRHYSEIHQ